MHWYLAAFKKYAVFQGRARRREYWTFHLINTAIYAVLSVIPFLSALQDREMSFADFFLKTKETNTWTYVQYLFSLLFFLPSLAVTVRRLHDIGKSGWWTLLAYGGPLFLCLFYFVSNLLLALSHNYALITLSTGLFIIGFLSIFILFLIWMLQDSQPGANKYGENPKA